MPKSRPTGATDVTEYFVMRDSTNHAPKTDVTITDIDIYYQEQGAAQSAKADLTALAAANSAHADNKGYHCGNAVYRIDWPDAAFDGGAGKSVILIVVCTGCDTIYREIQLSPPVDIIAISGDTTAADNCELMFDGTGYAGGTTKLGVDTVAISGDSTAADNLEAAADGTGYNLGGGDIVAASVTAGVTASTVSDKTGYALTAAYDAAKSAAPETGGNIAAIKTKTDNLPASPAAVGSAMTLDAAETGTGLTAVPWNASWDAEVQSECADALSAYDPPTATEMTSAFTEIKGATWSSATDTLEAIRDRGDSAWTTATGFATASDITTAHSTTDGKIDAVDDYVDTEVTAIKAVTDKLDTALELDGAVYRYTTNALEQASGTGATAQQVWEYATRTITALDEDDTTLDLDATIAAAVPTAAAIADAVWDEATADHSDVGSTGAAITAAGSAGDPWATALPGSYGAGTAGKIVGDNINAPIGTVDAVVDAIKAKTDSLTFTVAGDVDVNVQTWKGSTAPAMTGDAYARLGTPAGASVSADVAAVKSETAAIVADTNELQTNQGNWATATGFSTHSAADVKTAIEAAGSHLTLIKAKTDNLPSDPADQSAVEAAITAAHSTTNGKIDAVDDFVDTEVAAILAAVDTEVAAIKAKTDNLPASPAAVGSAMTLHADYDAAKTAATQASVNTIGGIVDDILEDTGTTIPAAITALTEAGVKKNTALSGFTFYMTDSTNHEKATGLTVTAERSLDGAAFAACANAVAELSDGCYKIDLADTDLNADVVALKFTATDADDLVITIRTSA